MYSETRDQAFFLYNVYREVKRVLVKQESEHLVSQSVSFIERFSAVSFLSEVQFMVCIFLANDTVGNVGGTT